MVRRFIQRILAKCVEDSVPDISKPPIVPEYLNRDSKIIEALESSSKAADIFRKRQLTACHLCPLRSNETLGDAAYNYGINEEEWIIELNFAVFCRIQEMYQLS